MFFYYETTCFYYEMIFKRNAQKRLNFLCTISKLKRYNKSKTLPLFNKKRVFSNYILFVFSNTSELMHLFLKKQMNPIIPFYIITSKQAEFFLR